jgi:glycerophosphoryl diester phosphodiesterase
MGGGAITIIAVATLATMPHVRRADIASGQRARPPIAARIVGLRGASAVAPENTLAAVRQAVAEGAGAVWVDARVTSDGVAVLLRDATLDRTSGCQGEVAAQTAAQVTACDAGTKFDARFSGERVPRLADVVGVLGGARLIVDLAYAGSDGDAAVVAALAGAASIDVTVVSDRSASLAAVKAARSGTHGWLRVDRGADWAQARAAGADGVSMPGELVTNADIAAAKVAGLQVAVHDPADEVALVDALLYGADAVAVTRVGPSVWAAGLTFRTLDGRDFGRPNASQTGFGQLMASGDVNGDGIMDLVIGAPQDSQRAAAAGWLGVALGGSDFPRRLSTATMAEPDGQWGAVVAVGDFNGDDNDDLVIGYPRSDRLGNDAGGLWLWDGSVNGMRSQPLPFGPAVGAGAQLGAVLAVGDVNGDGIDDLIAGAPGTNVNGRPGAGRVYVLAGRLDAGPTIGGALTLDRSLDEVPGDPTTREGFGASVALSDLDGDSLADIVVGVPEAEVDGARGAGQLIVFKSMGEDMTGALTFDEMAVSTIDRSDADVPDEALRADNWGARLHVADIDRDGFGDLIVPDPNATVAEAREAGDVTLLFGSATGRDPARTVAVHQDSGLLPDEAQARDRFGASLALGDIDGDALPDLIIGAPGEERRRLPGVGLVTTVWNSAHGVEPRAAAGVAPDIWPLRSALANGLGFGSAVAAGDFNGDGVADLAIANPNQTIDGVPFANALVMAWGWSATLPGVPPASPTPRASATPTASPTGPTPTASPTGPTPTPEPATATPVGPTSTPTRTPRPLRPAYLPYSARVHFLGRYGPGVPLQVHRPHIVPRRIHLADLQLDLLEQQRAPLGKYQAALVRCDGLLQRQIAVLELLDGGLEPGERVFKAERGHVFGRRFGGGRHVGVASDVRGVESAVHRRSPWSGSGRTGFEG